MCTYRHLRNDRWFDLLGVELLPVNVCKERMLLDDRDAFLSATESLSWIFDEQLNCAHRARCQYTESSVVYESKLRHTAFINDNEVFDR